MLLARIELVDTSGLPHARRHSQVREGKLLHTREVMGALLVAIHGQLRLSSKTAVIEPALAKKRIHGFAFVHFRSVLEVPSWAD